MSNRSFIGVTVNNSPETQTCVAQQVLGQQEQNQEFDHVPHFLPIPRK